MLPDGFVSAHRHMQLLLSMASHGPIIFPTGAADNFVWAHWNVQLLLPMLAWAHWNMKQLIPMALFGRIIFLSCAADALWWAMVLRVC